VTSYHEKPDVLTGFSNLRGDAHLVRTVQVPRDINDGNTHGGGLVEGGRANEAV
jgi:hypothetical protein